MEFAEFQESEIMFSDYSYNDEDDHMIHNHGTKGRHYYNKSSTNLKRINIPKATSQQQRRVVTTTVASSAPMTIPSSPRQNSSLRYDDDDVAFSQSSDEDYYDDDDDDDCEGMMTRLPPHIIVERRVSGEMARSFSPLKGRNLIEVRDSILRLTGFLEE